MEDEKACITSLTLGLGIGGGGGGYPPKKKQKMMMIMKNKPIKPVPSLDLTFGDDEAFPKEAIDDDDDDDDDDREEELFISLNNKRVGEEHSYNNNKHCPNGNNRDDSYNDENNNNNYCSRKKLRLTKEQSALLEENFKNHTTLNQAQKQALAKQLNLKHRQVEVWFQNRRARTKLKQTEVDCEFLKKCCERLTDENLRLKKELQELRAIKAGPTQSPTPPLYIQLLSSKSSPLTICSSCEELLKKTKQENI
ncbi:homeobox-leucine zipper protein HAT22 [Arachis duranensis]|uniref:Homeobox-leucine zipper protein HAT22 n=1 Tax=Arachis duranensis TaxID=130453 RepID=A0A6P4CQB9_ARADU|nr:homeobox-leucine zipper protein HAT22 [Arachis duranensis]